MFGSLQVRLKMLDQLHARALLSRVAKIPPLGLDIWKLKMRPGCRPIGLRGPKSVALVTLWRPARPVPAVAGRSGQSPGSQGFESI